MARQQGLKDGGPLYEENKKSFPKHLKGLFDSFRSKRTDEHIWVSDFVVLVERRKYLQPTLNSLKKANAYVFEGRTGRRSNRPSEYAAMLHDALDYWARGRLPHHLAVEFGRQGGEQFAENRRKSDKRMPRGEALKIWRDPQYSGSEALEVINEDKRYSEPWSRSAAFRPKEQGGLGPRGTISGPRGSWKK